MNKRYIQYSLIILDLASVAIGAILFSRTVSLVYPAMIAVVLPYIMRENKLYWRHGEIYYRIWLQLGQIIRTYFLIFILFCVYAFMTEIVGAKPDPQHLAIQFGLIFCLNIFLRSIFTGILGFSRRDKRKNYAVVGTGERAQVIGKEIEMHQKGKNLLGYIATEPSIENMKADNILGVLKNLEEIIEQKGVDSIIVVLDEMDLEQLMGVIDRVSYQPVDAFVYNDHFDIIRQRYKSVAIGDISVSPLERRLENRDYEIIKRMIDIGLSAVAITLLLPIFIVVSALVKISSKGPVFYVSRRVKNQNGDTFNFIKFRSMYVRKENTEKERGKGIDKSFSGEVVDTENTKVVDKIAVTPLGRFLRKSSIDELPQLFNVIKGDMSLVGPRPTTEYEFARYKDWHKRRLQVKPGITGLWQVVARSRSTFDDQVKLDLYYIDHRTIWFDVEILIKTVPVVLLGRGGG